MVLLALLVAAVAGCETSMEARWVEDVEELRQQATAARDGGQKDEAIEILGRVFELEPPGGPKAQKILQDAHFALGRLHLTSGRHVDAVAEANAGLARSSEESIFRANLLALRGMAHEAAGRRVEAASDYMKAIEIHDVLFKETLQAHQKETR